jgi:hypothetical protein
MYLSRPVMRMEYNAVTTSLILEECVMAYTFQPSDPTKNRVAFILDPRAHRRLSDSITNTVIR